MLHGPISHCAAHLRTGARKSDRERAGANRRDTRRAPCDPRVELEGKGGERRREEDAKPVEEPALAFGRARRPVRKEPDEHGPRRRAHSRAALRHECAADVHHAVVAAFRAVASQLCREATPELPLEERVGAPAERPGRLALGPHVLRARPRRRPRRADDLERPRGRDGGGECGAEHVHQCFASDD
eukprot:1561451-Prymnesium_polylepis.2